MKKKLALLVTALALTITLTLGGIFFQPNQMTIEADASTSISLFNHNGEMVRLQAQNILDALGDTPTINTTIDREMQFRLFSEAGLVSTEATALARMRWRITQVNGDKVTFWAYGGYRLSNYNEVGAGNVYSNSVLRTNLINDYTYLLARFPNLPENILPKGTNAHGAVPTDRFWIPSVQEVQNGDVWDLNSHLRSFPAFGTATSSWLRSATATGTVNAITANTTGDINLTGTAVVTVGLVVRPALHISLALLQEAAETGAGGGIIRPPDNDREFSTWRMVAGSVGGAMVFFLVILLAIALIKYIKKKKG